MGLLVWLSGRVRADRPRTLSCDDDEGSLFGPSPHPSSHRHASLNGPVRHWLFVGGVSKLIFTNKEKVEALLNLINLNF